MGAVRIEGGRRPPPAPAPGGRHRGRPRASRRRRDDRADILVESQAPFDHAFAAANGAHLVVDYDAGVSGAQLAATTRPPAVSRPAPVRGRSPRSGPGPVGEAKARPDRHQVVSRAADAGRHRSTGHDHGRTLVAGARRDRPRPGTAATLGPGSAVGDTIDAPRHAPAGPGGKAAGPSAPARRARRHRALVRRDAHGRRHRRRRSARPDLAAWISPTDLAALTPGARPAQEMLYRVDPSAHCGRPRGRVDLDHREPARPTRSSTAETYLATKADVDSDGAAVRPDPARVLGVRAARGGVHHRQRRQWHRPDELPGYRGDEGRRLHAAPGDGILLAQILVPVTIGAVLGVDRDRRQPADRRADRAVVRAAGGGHPSAPVSSRVLLRRSRSRSSPRSCRDPGRAAERVGAITRGTAPSAAGGGGRLRGWDSAAARRRRPGSASRPGWRTRSGRQ